MGESDVLYHKPRLRGDGEHGGKRWLLHCSVLLSGGSNFCPPSFPSLVKWQARTSPLSFLSPELLIWDCIHAPNSTRGISCSWNALIGYTPVCSAKASENRSKFCNRTQRPGMAQLCWLFLDSPTRLVLGKPCLSTTFNARHREIYSYCTLPVGSVLKCLLPPHAFAVMPWLND